MRYAFLDYLRIFAFLSVLIGHKFATELQQAINNPSLHATPKLILQLLEPFTLGGGAGVVVFFLISGYIISHILYQDSSISFLIKRIFRIYPLYVVAVLLQYTLLKTQNPEHEIILSHIIIQLLLLGDFFNVPYTLAGVEWTLRIEILFYLFMAIIRYLAPKSLGTTWFFPLLFVVVIVSVALPPIPSAPFLFNNYLLLYSPFLLVGCAFYLLETQKTTLLTFLAFTLLVFCLYWYGISKHQPGWLGAHFALLGVGVFALAWKFRESFSAGALVLVLSQLTYSVYLFHNWLFDYFYTIAGTKLTALGLLMITCYLFYRLIEKPSLEFGKRLTKKES